MEGWTYKNYSELDKSSKYLSRMTDTGAEIHVSPDIIPGVFLISVLSHVGNGVLAEAYWEKEGRKFSSQLSGHKIINTIDPRKLLENILLYRNELEELGKTMPEHAPVLNEILGRIMLIRSKNI